MTALDLIVELCRAMPTAKVEELVLSGRIEQADEQVLKILCDLDRDTDYYTLPLGFNQQSAIGQPFDVNNISLPRLQNHFFAQSWEDLLAHHDFRSSSPSVFYVHETDYYSKSDSACSQAIQYFNIVKLIQFLKTVADVSQPYSGQLELVFLLKEKLSINVDYSAENFCDLPGLEKFITEFSIDDPHTEQRKSIIKTVLSEILKNIEPKERFRHLLKVFDELVKRSNENFQLYVTGFSFEKVREEVEANRLEYTLKLNKVFSEIQNQLLAVPAALLLIGSQMEIKNELTLKNSSVLVGVLIFSWFMNMLLKNQKHSLQAINDEICELKNKLKLEHAPLIAKLMPAYESLDKRHNQQSQSLLIVDASIAGVLIFCGYLFGKYSALW